MFSEFTFIKTKHFYSSKDTTKRMKGQSIHEEENTAVACLRKDL